MNHETQTSVRVYRIKPLTRIILIFLFLFYLFVFLGLLNQMLTESHTFVEFIGRFMAMGIMLLFMFGTIMSWCARLELAPEGATSILPGFYRIYTPWENIEKIGDRSRRRTRKSFILRKPAVQNIPFEEGKQRRQAVIEKSLFLSQDLPKTVFTTIPFFAYIPKKEWRDGDLQAYLLRYAPHLLENRDEYGRIVSL